VPNEKILLDIADLVHLVHVEIDVFYVSLCSIKRGKREGKLKNSRDLFVRQDEVRRDISRILI